ncbi:hypothetical protein Q3G72_033572 [Acer saccharum]|nr:hypothetical protein Q3G72_033572 [Acer saccharum]
MGKKSVLSAKPRSFKLHRKSSAASKLKSVISDNLHHYLSDYSDTVLAEYILVLVCNGKDQYQTRDELDAFLAHRSSHFVSWLWDHLLKHDYHTIEHTYSHPTDATLPSSGALHKDSTINNHATAHSHHLPPKDETNNPLPASASESEPSNMELGEGAPQHPGSAAPLSEVYINTELSPALANESINGVEKPIKIVHSSGNGSPGELLYLPKREPVPVNLHLSTSEYPLGKQISASNVVRRSLSPRSISMLSQQHEKSRVSVWDRLGKPCDSTATRGETAEPRRVHVTKQHEQVLNQHMLMHPQLSDEASRSNMLGVPGLGNSCGMNNLSKCRKIEQAVSTIHKSHIQNNIGKKRHSSEISTGPAISSVSLVGENNVDLQHKKKLQELQKSIVANKDSKPSSLPPQTLSTDSQCNITATVKPVQEEVLNVKQRLHQIEIEMSKIRSKQAQKEKDVKFKSLLHSGALKHPEEDIELRTVLVTNVHFAATKETLSLYFAKCGVVVHVMILIDKSTLQPKRSAYVTFASKESVDNAVALSGASLLSRTIKVVRKSEAITATTATQFTPTLCQSSLSYQNRKTIHGTPFYSSRHLQWRRDSMSAPSEASAPDSSTNQQPPGSTLSAKTKEANPSTELYDKQEQEQEC